jgi:hypothetical protein
LVSSRIPLAASPFAYRERSVVAFKIQIYLAMPLNQQPCDDLARSRSVLNHRSEADVPKMGQTA